MVTTTAEDPMRRAMNRTNMDKAFETILSGILAPLFLVGSHSEATNETFSYRRDGFYR